MSKSVYLILPLLILALSGPVRAAGFASSVYLSANPDIIVADGKSVTTISAEVRDSSGDLVPDGTLVSFSSSLGTIQTTVTTTAGVARARLTSGLTVGAAAISAWVTQGGAVGQVKVDFLAPGTEIPRESFITISSDTYLVYDVGKMQVEALGGVNIFHRGLVITADEAQIDLQTDMLKCRRGTGGDPIKLSRGRNSMEASLLFYKLSEMKGQAVVEEESGTNSRVAFRGADLAVMEEPEEGPQDLFDFTEQSDVGSVVIKASSITVRPREEIHFRRAKVYVDGKKVLSVPLHVLPLDGSGNSGSDYVGWGTNGIRLDVPFYYSLSPHSTGSVHLSRGQQAGWGFYSGNTGLSLDLVQDYTSPGGGEGGFALSRITSGDWGAHWHHSQQYDSGSRLYSYVEFPAHQDLFGMVNVSKPLSRASLGINLYGNKFKDQAADLSTDVFLQSLPKSIAGGKANYVLLARTSYASSSSGTGSGLGAGLQMQLFGRPISFSKRTSLTNSFSIGHDWGGSRSGVTVMGNSSLTHRLGKAGNLGLTYSYARDAYSTYATSFGHHRLSGNLFYAPNKRWYARVFSTYTLDASLSSTFIDLSYKIHPRWRLNLLQTIQEYDKYDYSDIELALGRQIGEHEVMLVWSKSRNKLRLEFAAARF
ncbi:MAG: hypothetical protein HYX78_13005 [Armatimonadetes bacterium]|nr:hypothetical protein [Armatimonadota bacterium]